MKAEKMKVSYHSAEEYNCNGTSDHDGILTKFSMA